jgi:hypothetical protein
MVTQLVHASAKLLGEAGSVAMKVERSLIRNLKTTSETNPPRLPLSGEEATDLRIRQPEVPASAVKFATKKRDLTSGMELLAMEFLVKVVDGVVRPPIAAFEGRQSDAVDQLDIMKHRLCFDELVRRGNLWAVVGPALKVYTVDEYGFYGKKIRCEAMKELATRTGPSAVSGDPVEPRQLSEKAMESRPVGI